MLRLIPSFHPFLLSLLPCSKQPSVYSFHLYAVAVQLALEPLGVLSTENKTTSVAVHRHGSHKLGFEVKIINGDVRMLSLPRSWLADEQNEKMSLCLGCRSVGKRTLVWRIGIGFLVAELEFVKNRFYYRFQYWRQDRQSREGAGEQGSCPSSRMWVGASQRSCQKVTANQIRRLKKKAEFSA